MSLNLIQFASTFTSTRDDLILRSHPVIVKTFPNYSGDPKGPNYPLYCKYQLIKLKPWLNSTDTIWATLTPSNDTYISMYHDFLQNESEHIQLQDHVQELERAEQYLRIHSEEDSEDEQEYQSSNHQDQWMLLCQLNPVLEQQQSCSDVDFDWLLSCPNWINATKAQNDITPQQTSGTD